jgi:hypothetical protein
MPSSAAVLPRTEVTVVNIALVSGSDDGPATVGVDVTWRGETRNILVRVVRESEAWRVANISYGSGKNPVDHYRAITGR